MDVVWRKSVLALRFCLHVVTVGVHAQTIVILEKKSGAAWIQDVIGPNSIFHNVHQLPLARRRRPKEIALGWVQPVQMTRSAGVKELLIIVQIKTIEVDTLAPLNLL